MQKWEGRKSRGRRKKKKSGVLSHTQQHTHTTAGDKLIISYLYLLLYVVYIFLHYYEGENRVKIPANSSETCAVIKGSCSDQNLQVGLITSRTKC